MTISIDTTTKTLFESVNSSPHPWHNKSTDLIRSARVLDEAIQNDESLYINCTSTVRMLAGLALELLFKSHSIASGIDLEHIHDLVKLAKKAELTTDENEDKILKILSQYIIWDGKYPTPKKVKKC